MAAPIYPNIWNDEEYDVLCALRILESRIDQYARFWEAVPTFERALANLEEKRGVIPARKFRRSFSALRSRALGI